MEITPINNETRRQTGDQAWPGNAPQSSGKIMRAVVELKGMLQRDMPSRSIERANALCNIILGEVDTVHGLENTVLLGGHHG